MSWGGNKSDDCYDGRHDDCDGCNLNSPMGCECDCHFQDDDDEDKRAYRKLEDGDG